MKATKLLQSLPIILIFALVVISCSRDAEKKASTSELEKHIDSLELKLKATEDQLSNVRIELADCMEKQNSLNQAEKNE